MKAKIFVYLLMEILFIRAAPAFSHPPASAEIRVNDTTFALRVSPLTKNTTGEKAGFFGRLKIKLINLVTRKNSGAEIGKTSKKTAFTIVLAMLIVGAVVGLLIMGANWHA